jgi:hypothetical protein
VSRTRLGLLAGLLACGTADAGLQVSPELELDLPRAEPAIWFCSGTGIAFDGSRFVVIWDDYRSGWPEVYGAHLAPSGAHFAEPTGVRLLPTSLEDLAPTVACSPAGCILTWVLPPAASALRLDSTLAPLDGAPLTLATDALYVAPHAAASSAGYAVTYATADGGVLRGLGPDGGPSAPWALLPGATQAPAIAFDGANYILAGETANGANQVNVYAQRVAPDGGPVDPSPVWFPTAIAGPISTFGPAAVAAGAGVSVAAWSNAQSVEGAAFADGGWLSASPGVVATSGIAGTFPGVGFDGVAFRLVWTDLVTGGTDVADGLMAPDGGAIPPNGVVLPGPLSGSNDPQIACGAGLCGVLETSQAVDAGLSSMTTSWVAETVALLTTGPMEWPSAGSRQLYPSVACGAHACLAAWLEQRLTGESIQARRFAFDGGSLGASFTLGGAQGLAPPVVAASASQFVVVWNQVANGPFAAARVADDGTVLDPSGILGPRNFLVPDGENVAFDGNAYVVTGQAVGSFDGGAAGFGPFAWRLGLDGDAGPPYLVCPGCLSQFLIYSAVSVASAGGTTWAVWLGTAGTVPDVLAARMDSSGAPLDVAPLRVIDGGSAALPIVVANAQGAMVVLRLETLQSVRLSADGGVRDPAPLTLLDGGLLLNVSGAVDGTGYLLVYEDDAVPGDAQLRALNVLADGETAGGPMTVVAEPTNALYPALAPFDGGFFLAYSLYDPSPTEQNLRARGRILTNVALPDAGVAAVPDGGAVARQSYAVGCDCSSSGGLTAMIVAVLVVCAAHANPTNRLRRRRGSCGELRDPPLQPSRASLE